MEYTGHTDEPATTDSLGFEAYARGIARFIAGCSTPMTLSLQGD